MGFKMKEKSNKKYSYKSFSEWLKSRKYRKRLGAVLLLLFIISFGFFPYWLFKFPTGNLIEGTFDWEDDMYGYWVDEAVVGYTVELWDDGVMISSAITDALGEVSFYVPDMTSTYQLIFSNGLTFAVVDADVDGYFDLIDGVMPMDTKVVEVRFQTTEELAINTDIDIFRFDGIDWILIGTQTTNGVATTPIYLIDGDYQIGLTTFTVDLHASFSSDIPAIFYLEPIGQIISICIIIMFLLFGKKSRIISINKSVRNLKEIKRFINAIDTLCEITINKIKLKI